MTTARLSYRLDGPPGAPVVVLSNSLGTTTKLWDAQIPELTRYFRVLRYDHRGHGLSDSPPGPYEISDLGGDLVALLDELGIEQVGVVGLSLGGMVGLWVAIHAPERVASLVLCCTAAVLPPASAWRDRAATVRSSGTSVLAGTLFERWFTPAWRASHPDQRERFSAMLASCDAEGYASCCEAIASMDMSEDVGAVAAPTLVICGAEDPVVTPQAGVDLAGAIPAASLLVLGGAAHLANVEQPDRFSTALVDHFTGGEAALGARVRRAILGDAHVDSSLEAAGPFARPWQDFLTRYAWGGVWARPGLADETRRLLTISMLVCLGRLDELELHVRAATRSGLAPEVLREVLVQCAIYAGVPAANSAFAVASRVLADSAGDPGTCGPGSAPASRGATREP